MHRIALYIFIFTFSSLMAYGQAREPDQNQRFWDRVFVGGNLGASFGSVTYVDLSPLVGYRFTDRASAGVGVTYQYLKDKRFEPDFVTHMYGGRVFGRYLVLDFLFLHSELEVLSLDCFQPAVISGNNVFVKERVIVPNLLLGGGLYQSLGGNAGITAMALYNVLDSDCSPYASPLILRIGFNVGL